ncbi:MAG: hypothetical protein RIF33_06225 [Cyclobacteriaceae bacterium]
MLTQSSSSYKYAPILFILFFLLVSDDLWAQSLSEFNQSRLNINKSGMMVLGGWAAGNIILNPILGRGTSGSDKYFYQMNTWWNVVNLTIAGFGYYGAVSDDPQAFDALASLQEQHSIEKILLVNAALDVGYILGGLYMKERSLNVSKNADRLHGFGRAVMLQGGFLLVFDAIFYAVHKSHSKELMTILSSINLSSQGFSLRNTF